MEYIRTRMGGREAVRISGIPLSLFYYRQRKRDVTRLNPSVVEDTLNIASERPTYRYRRIWAVPRNNGTAVNPKSVRRVLRINNLSLPYVKHKGRTKSRIYSVPRNQINCGKRTSLTHTHRAGNDLSHVNQ
ncbi:MAG: IS3 family transposase [Thermoplasmatales archaeon]|nr:IS3 family transposase [Thermoplasmatales archaeon]